MLLLFIKTIINHPNFKSMSVRTLFMIITLLSGISANATNYYFSTSDGDDSRSFSEAQDPSTPWQSIDKLNSIFRFLQPGDQALFKSGDTFFGSIVTAKSGTEESPIVLSSYGLGAKPVISGLIRLSVWNYKGNGIYESGQLPTGVQLNVVLLDNKQYAMGRYPNVSDENGGYLNFVSHGYNYINDNENTLTSQWEGAQLVVRTSRFTMERSTITDISGNTISYSPSFRAGLTDKFGYFIQNSIKTLDQFGEWYYNPTTHRIQVYYGNRKPYNIKVQLSAADVLLKVQSSHIVVDNLAFRGANTYAIWGDWRGVSDLQVKNCTIDFSGIDGIALANRRDFVMDNTTITNSNSVGVSFYTGNFNPVVKNSTIRNSGTFPGMLQMDAGAKYAMGIYSTEGLTATNNQVINTGYNGIMFTGDNNLIQNNYIDTFCTILDDGGGIYTANYTPKGQKPPVYTNRRIIGNIILHGMKATDGAYTNLRNYYPTEGIYMDAYVSNIEILNNTVAYCGDGAIYVHNNTDFTIAGNVFYNNTTRQLGFQHDGQGGQIFGGVVKRNQMFSQSSTQDVMQLRSAWNDMDNFASFDSNYYCRPSNEDGLITTTLFGNKQNLYNLSQWQNAYNKDWHSKKTPVTVSNPDNVLFLYNASTSNTTIHLQGTYISVTGDRYSGKLTLDPYTSVILMPGNNGNNASAMSSTGASAAAVTNTAIAGPGYVNTEAAKLAVKAYPNPSSHYFNVTTQGGSTSEPMTLRVLDLSGRLLQVKTGVTTNSTLQIGQDLAAGSYVLELLQGNNKVEQKVIKLAK
jgi:parallel beta-helix repeat protein